MKLLKNLLLTAVLHLGLAGSLFAGEHTKINTGWKFSLSDTPEAKQVTFDDSRWRTLEIPHDWAFELGYSEDGAQGDKGGYAGGGIGWYRKSLNISSEQLKGKVLTLDFDAVYMNSEVWVNGEYLGKRPYGYISFSYDVTNILKEGENIIAVRVDCSKEPSARWYHGCGIYGDVKLSSYAPSHVVPNSLFITTPEVSDEKATVNVKCEVAGNEKGVTVEYSIFDAQGRLLDSAKGGALEANLTIENPSRWSPDSPYLYNMVTKVYKGKKVVDQTTTRFGVRTLHWDAENGFFLNGEVQKIFGVCEHLEGGPVGAAWNEKLLRWKLQLLKDMGCNAIRTSHNPMTPIFYHLCDEMGIMVADEIFDGWKRKADYDYGQQAFNEWWERDLRDFIRRDRNHPSIIVWCAGNETGGEVAKDLVRIFHEEDGTRLVTSGHSGSDQMDIFGVNGHSENRSFIEGYKPRDNKAFVGTETPHTWQVRSFYRTMTWYRDGNSNPNGPFKVDDLTEKEIFGYDWTDPKNKTNAKQIFNSSYDNAMVRITARKNIEVTRDLPWYSGNFRWTGFDYLGEAGYVHGGWPFRAFMGGVLDMAGFEKDHYYLYQSQWRPDYDMVHILPHWTHPDMEQGTLVPVWVYTTGNEAELFLNGESLGRKKNGAKWDEMQIQWLVPYTEGTIKAVAYRDGELIGTTEFTTAKAPAQLTLKSDNDNLQSGAEDVAIVDIDIRDAEGVFHPFGENRVYFHIDGDAFIRSLESGSPVDVECNFNAKSKAPFYGLLRAFVQADGSSEDIVLAAAAICGDKSLKQSNLVSIDIQSLALRGEKFDHDYQIYYSTDGSYPSRHSTPYKGAFEVEPNTQVRAVVYRDIEPIFEMSEGFGDGTGTHWGIPGEDVPPIKGEMAIRAKHKNCSLLVKNGEKLLVLQEGGIIDWYQENDGGERMVNLIISLAPTQTRNPSEFELWVNGRLLEKVVIEASKNQNIREITRKFRIGRGGNNITIKRVGGVAPAIQYINIED